jgi:membrane protein DedA with SNARE-associated domain
MMSGTLGAEGPLAAYAGLFCLLVLAWAGLPTAGQAALVGAGVLAAEGELDIGLVVAVGTVASITGGIVAYVLGRSGGRALWAAPGPMYAGRLRALESGERLFARYGHLALFFVPMWLAGIARMPWRAFLFWGSLAALVWTLVFGLGGYVVGPAFSDLAGRWTWPLLGAAAVVAGGVALYRRRRASTSPAAEGSAAKE